MTPRPARPSSRRAFTLVEILATLMLAAIVLPVVVQGISLSLSASGVARRQAQAALLAQEKLSELVATGQLQRASLGGDFGTDWPGYRWIAELNDFDGSTLRQLDVTVLWTRNRQQRTYTVSTLVYSAQEAIE